MTAPQQNIAAFFDLDGTLLPPPSLEWRFIGYLLERDEIASAHVARWLGYFAKTILRDPHSAIAANKFYLAGIRTSLIEDWENSLAPPTSLEDPFPLYPAGLQRIHWHRSQGHRIFLITGAPAPLAQIIARRIAAQIQAPIEARATQLEVSQQVWHSHSWLCSSTQWTGRLASQHMSNQAKSRALIALAVTHDLDLTKSYAYGNTNADVPMLESVGNPRAINPQRRLAQIAHFHRWPILHWKEPAIAAAPNRHTTQFATKVSP
ncbi:MAG: HAD-IB family phosphatase [Candidatus Acidiferrales bacterium]